MREIKTRSAYESSYEVICCPDHYFGFWAFVKKFTKFVLCSGCNIIGDAYSQCRWTSNADCQWGATWNGRGPGVTHSPHSAIYHGHKQQPHPQWCAPPGRVPPERHRPTHDISPELLHIRGPRLHRGCPGEPWIL